MFIWLSLCWWWLCSGKRRRHVRDTGGRYVQVGSDSSMEWQDKRNRLLYELRNNNSNDTDGVTSCHVVRTVKREGAHGREHNKMMPSAHHQNHQSAKAKLTNAHQLHATAMVPLVEVSEVRRQVNFILLCSFSFFYFHSNETILRKHDTAPHHN